jgi:hypothetical protein
MDSDKDSRVNLAARIYLLCDESKRKKSVTDAMRDAGFSEAEIKCKTRAKETAVQRAHKELKNKKAMSIDQPLKEVSTDYEFPVSPLSEVSPSFSNDTMTSVATKTVLPKQTSITLPGMKVVRQTPHQVHAMAQNSFLMRKLRDTAIKEVTTAWVEASQAEKKGEPHIMKKDIIEMINNKPQYKGLVTHITQEMELLIGELKSTFYKNLEKLTRGQLMRCRTVPSGSEIVGLLLFGGTFSHDQQNIDVDHYANAFQVAGCNEKIKRYFEKIGFAPFSRNYLNSKLVRHDSAEDPMSEEYKALEYHTATACGFLNVFEYNGSLLLAKVDRKLPRVAEQQTLTRPAIIDRAKALAVSVTHGQQFKVTGGHHLTSDDFL